MLPADAVSGYIASTQAQQGAQAQAALRLRTLSGEGAKPDRGVIQQAAQEFEALFIAEMVGHMFGESVGDEMFGDEQTRDIYKGLMMEQYGKEIARAGGIGIADYVKRELLRLQEI